VENEALSDGDPVPAEPRLSPENAENILADAEAVTQAEIAAETPATDESSPAPEESSAPTEEA
jgi:hypothetical protein